MEPQTEITKAIIKEVLQYAERKGWIKNLQDVFRKKHRILLLGSTGVGKTQFLDSFADPFAEAIDQMARTEFAKTRRHEVQGKLIEFIDTPGQVGHKSRRTQAIRRALQKNLSGVINVVAYGYHQYGEDRDRVLNGHAVRPEYLDACRKTEIALLPEWVPLLKDEWIITVASKADIWWNDRSTVLPYYSSGEYEKAMIALNNTNNRVTKAYSSVVSNFHGVIPCSGEFDDGQRRRQRKLLYTAIMEAIGRDGDSK